MGGASYFAALFSPQILCSLWLLTKEVCPTHWALLTRCPTGESCCRPLWNRQTLFGFLPPGDYLLTLGHGESCTKFLLALSPGKNLILQYDRATNRCRWWQDGFSYPFNTL